MNELPEDRVIAYAEEALKWGVEHIATTGEYNTSVRYSLTLDDLRDVLDELAEHQKILIQIDEALDDPDWYNGQLAIRSIMGRPNA